MRPLIPIIARALAMPITPSGVPPWKRIPEMQKLRFYAKGSATVSVPFSRLPIGQAASFVGRTFDPKARTYPATLEPYEVEANSDAGRRLVRLVRIDGDLWPADEATAAACGVPFVPVEIKDGVAVPKETKPSGGGKTSASKGD